MPGKLTHPPGSDSAHPGIFKHGPHIVRVSDLRFQFGVPEEQWQQPGRLIISQQDDGYTGFWIDEVIDVISFPEQGWGKLPPYLPRGIFSRTLLHKQQIQLYAEFSKLKTLQGGGYLKQYLDYLQQQSTTTETGLAKPQTHHATATISSAVKTPSTIAVETGSPREANTVSSPETNTGMTQTASASQETFTHRRPANNPVISSSRNTPAAKPSVMKPAIPKTTTVTRQVTAFESQNQATKTKPSSSRTNDLVNELRHQQISSTEAADETTTTGAIAVLLIFIILVTGLGSGVYFWFQTENLGNKTYSREITPLSPEPLKGPTPVYEPVVEQPVTTIMTEPLPDSRDENKEDEPQVTVQQDENRGDEPHATIQQDENNIVIILDEPKTSTAQQASKVRVDNTAPQHSGAVSTLQETSDKAEKPITPVRHEIIHEVVKGDTLWAIAKRYVKDPFRYPELARLSDIRNPHKIYPGNKVHIIQYRNPEQKTSQ